MSNCRDLGLIVKTYIVAPESEIFLMTRFSKVQVHLNGWKKRQAVAASPPITEALACHSLPPRPWVVVTPTSRQAAARAMYSALHTK